jgi:hypothetical protein
MIRNRNEEFFVIHPLDDVREEKIDLSRLGPMKLTRTVRVSLMALRGYFILMLMLVVYHVLVAAGIVVH